MSALPEEITIGQLSERSGAATSALRFYEERDLITSHRTSGNQRRFHRSTLRRVAVIKAAQELGITLADVGAALDAIPHDKAPTKRDWARLSSVWKKQLNDRIAHLERLRDQADSCVQCGCLSLQSCGLFNPQDKVGGSGAAGL